MKYLAFPVLLLLASPACAANCSIERFTFLYGADVNTHMAARSGVGCRIGLNPLTRLKSSRIEQNAQNGTVTSADDRHWIYKSRPGYSGKDSFVVLISGESTWRSRLFDGDTKINVDVDVTP